VRRRRRAQDRGAVTIAAPATGETLEAQLEEDTFNMLWLIH
jgi:hypothetical protein